MSEDLLDSIIGNITTVITDIDGVLTDGGMYYSEFGDEIKKFNVRDGVGVMLLQSAGLKVGAISGEKLSLIDRRLKKIKMDLYYLGIKNKLKCLDNICRKMNCSSDSIAYIGDEINDYPLLGKVGLFMVPLDACDELRSRADIVINVKGGDGVLRSAAQIILSRSGKYNFAIENYNNDQKEVEEVYD